MVNKNALAQSGVAKAYFLGASWNGDDQTSRFLAEGIWESGRSDGYYNDEIMNMEPGDHVAIKSSFVKRNDLPFETNGNDVSCMLIKARGVIRENPGDGKKLFVDWEQNYEPRLWFFFTSRKTIWEVENNPDDWKYGALLDFAFSDAEQNYEQFTEDPFWSDRFGHMNATDDIVDKTVDISEYLDKDFLNDVYIDQDGLTELKHLVIAKKNVIIQGAPGTGKTFVAKRLAYVLMGQKDDERIRVIQFHQSTSYEDFVVGYRPDGFGGFALENGEFVAFCNKARADSDRPYFFIIDEINRAEISRVLGELLMLIEADHRGEEITLALSGESFSVPNNVYIIGMMNTADRGLALIDYALRRRFAFFEMGPAFGNEKFMQYVEGLGSTQLSKLVGAVADLNTTISQDPSLGEGFCIGHSYFCGFDSGIQTQDLESIVKYELAPLLNEYWFDDRKKADSEVKKLQDSIQ